MYLLESQISIKYLKPFIFKVYALLIIMPKCSPWFSSLHQRLSCKMSLRVVRKRYVTVFAITFHDWVMRCQTLDPSFVENCGGNDHKEKGPHGPWGKVVNA